MDEFTSGIGLAENIFLQTNELFKKKEIEVVNIQCNLYYYIEFEILFKDKYHLIKRIHYAYTMGNGRPNWSEYNNTRERIYEIISYISIMGYDLCDYQKDQIKQFFKDPHQIDIEHNNYVEKIYSEVKENNIKENRIIKTYIMKDNHNNLYKIGRSINPEKREKTLQSEKPSIKLIKTFDKNIENELHIKYDKFRVRGEWFNLNNIQVKYICTHY